MVEAAASHLLLPSTAANLETALPAVVDALSNASVAVGPRSRQAATHRSSNLDLDMFFTVFGQKKFQRSDFLFWLKFTHINNLQHLWLNQGLWRGGG